MSSCVESGLLPVIYISAPPSANISQRWAVFASRCTDNAIFLPLKGLVSLNSFSSPARSGICLLTHSIFNSPSLQSSGFLISLVITVLFINSDNLRKNPVTSSCVRHLFRKIMSDPERQTIQGDLGLPERVCKCRWPSNRCSRSREWRSLSGLRGRRRAGGRTGRLPSWRL